MNHYPQPTIKKRFTIFTFISLPIIILSTLVFSWICSVVVEVLCMLLIWPEEGSQHARAMLTTEMGYLSGGVQRSLYDAEPWQLAQDSLAKVNHTFEQSGLSPLLRRLASPHNPADSRSLNRLRSVYARLHEYVAASIAVTQVFCIRLVIIALSLPIFVLFGAGAMVDGLVQRDLRKFGCGNESAWLYHKVKKYLGSVLVMTLMFYLSLPISVHPNLVFMPAAVLFGFLLFLTTSRFKKYL